MRVQRSSSVRQGSQTQQCTTPYPRSLLCPWWVWSKYKLVCTSMPPGDEMSGRALKFRKRTNLDSHTSPHHTTMSVSVHLADVSFHEALTNQRERCPVLCFHFSLTLMTHKDSIHVDSGGFLLWVFLQKHKPLKAPTAILIVPESCLGGHVSVYMPLWTLWLSSQAASVKRNLTIWFKKQNPFFFLLSGLSVVSKQTSILSSNRSHLECFIEARCREESVHFYILDGSFLRLPNIWQEDTDKSGRDSLKNQREVWPITYFFFLSSDISIFQKPKCVRKMW